MSQAVNTSSGSDASPARRGDGSLSLDAALDWFEDHVWHSHQICSNCFSRLKHSQTVERDAWGHTDTDTWRTDSATLEHGHDPLPDPPKTTCEECGSMRGLKQYDTLSKSEAVDRVPDLVDRVTEAGYLVDVSTVYGVVRRYKSRESHASNDKEIFATAAALGVEKA